MSTRQVNADTHLRLGRWESFTTNTKDQGLVVIGVPSNDFGSQEPLASDKIPDFCVRNFGATFPLSGKVSLHVLPVSVAHSNTADTSAGLY